MATKKGAGKKATSTKPGASKKGATTKAAGKKTAAKKGTTRQGASKKSSSKKGASKRELIDTGTDKRYVRRGPGGEFKESVDQGRSLSQDMKRNAKTKAPAGQGDKGD